MMEIIGRFKSEFQTILVTTDKLFLSKWLKRIKRLNSQVWDYMFPKLLETFYLLLWICLLQYRNTLMVPTAITLMVSEEPLIFVTFLERFQVSSSQIQSIFFHFGNLMVLKETKTNWVSCFKKMSFNLLNTLILSEYLVKFFICCAKESYWKICIRILNHSFYL